MTFKEANSTKTITTSYITLLCNAKQRSLAYSLADATCSVPIRPCLYARFLFPTSPLECTQNSFKPQPHFLRDSHSANQSCLPVSPVNLLLVQDREFTTLRSRSPAFPHYLLPLLPSPQDPRTLPPQSSRQPLDHVTRSTRISGSDFQRI